MKIFFLTTFILVSFISQGQLSYDFSTVVPPSGEVATKVEQNHYGKYKADSINTWYEFGGTGIWVVSTIYSSVSRQTIRESSTYEIRNGFIFGVTTDSLPCILEGEFYFFALRHNEQLIGGDSKNTLVRVSKNTYIINFFENSGYTPSKLIFSGKKLSIQHFDYETGTTIFGKIDLTEEKVQDGMTFIQLAPTKKEWNALEKKGLFGDELIYKRIDI
jgi:hypothetical protein